MRGAFVSLGAAVAALVLAAPSGAHHSAAVQYLMDQEITIQGEVTRYSLGNPHARIFLLVTDENCEAAEWMAEGGSRTVLLRKGWTGREFSPGDVITIIGSPARDGSNAMHWKQLVLPDGRELFGEDLDPGFLEELRARRGER